MAKSRKAGGGVVVTGSEYLDDALAAFEPKVRKALTRKATRAGAKVVLEATRILVPHAYGTLESSLKVKAMKGRKGSRRGGKFGHAVVTGEGFFLGETFYGGFLELGTKQRQHKSGKSVGAIGKYEHDFLREALYQNKSAIRSIFQRTLGEVIREADRKKRSSHFFGRQWNKVVA